MALRGIQEYNIALERYDNIALVFDSCNIVIASAIYSCIPRKKAIQYYYYLYQAEDLIKALPP